MSADRSFPEKFISEPPILDRDRAIELLRGNPIKETEQFLVIEGNTAWIQVEVRSREAGLHQATRRHLIDIVLAKLLVEAGFVVMTWHPPEFGGERLELHRT